MTVATALYDKILLIKFFNFTSVNFAELDCCVGLFQIYHHKAGRCDCQSKYKSNRTKILNVSKIKPSRYLLSNLHNTPNNIANSLEVLQDFLSLWML